MGLEHLNHLVELFIAPIRRQLAYTALNGGFGDARRVCRLWRQQRPWLTDVVKNIGHQQLPDLANSAGSQGRCKRRWRLVTAIASYRLKMTFGA